MDFTKLDFHPPFKAHSSDDRGALAWTVQDDAGKMLVSCGLYTFGRTIAEAIATAMNSATRLELQIPESAWSDSGIDEADPKARLLAHVHINGVSFHAEALEVHRPDDVQEVRAPAFEPEWQGLAQINGQDGGPFAELTIGGRQYVVVVTPHSD